MELKFTKMEEEQTRLESSNRTFMELKCWKIICGIFRYLCSNRTFMELKYLSYKLCLILSWF